jgi:hypothetical protein
MAGRFRVHKGVLPDFIIIGAQKAGTTSLYGYIQELTDALPCAWKEVQFFHGNRYARGLDWYKRQFLDLQRRAMQAVTSAKGFPRRRTASLLRRPQAPPL